MELVIQNGGGIRCLYGEEIELRQLGEVSIIRGSHVEPTTDGQWTADLSPMDGPILGPFAGRSAALDAEIKWLLDHWLLPGS
jgi:hypothetical protein